MLPRITVPRVRIAVLAVLAAAEEVEPEQLKLPNALTCGNQQEWASVAASLSAHLSGPDPTDGLPSICQQLDRVPRTYRTLQRPNLRQKCRCRVLQCLQASTPRAASLARRPSSRASAPCTERPAGHWPINLTEVANTLDALRDALSVANWSLASGARVRETSLRSSRRPWSEGSFSWRMSTLAARQSLAQIASWRASELRAPASSARRAVTMWAFGTHCSVMAEPVSVMSTLLSEEFLVNVTWHGASDYCQYHQGAQPDGNSDRSMSSGYGEVPGRHEAGGFCGITWDRDLPQERGDTAIGQTLHRTARHYGRAVEDHRQLLPLMAMIREGQLSPEVLGLFRRKAHAAPRKEPQVKKEDSGARQPVDDFKPGDSRRASSTGKILLQHSISFQKLVSLARGTWTPPLALPSLRRQELLWSSALHSADRAALTPAAKGAEAAKVETAKVKSFHELFCVITRIGEGATGTVILAKDRASEQRRAVKVVHKTPGGQELKEENRRFHGPPPAPPGQTEQLKLQELSFQREVKVLSALDHPHIVRLHQHFEDPQAWYLVLDYCPCGDLVTLMDEHREEGHKTMPLPFSLKVLHQVLLALAHMHKRQMMHLDIKGQNLMFQVSYRDTILPHERAGHPAPMMVMKAPHVVLVDFGTARRMEEVKGEPIGTCAFMAPEVWKGCLSSKADVFSLGVVFFQMLAGKLPFNPPDTIDLAQEKRRREPTTPLCQEVCDSLLQVPQASRPQAEELLLHPLFADLHEHHPEEETVAIPTHYAQRLVNFAGKDVLQKCMRLRLARAWSSNQMPSFRRLFVALAPQGRLPPARLVAALSCSGLAERYGSAALVAQAAQQAADALVNEEGAISFTLFVAALADLGDPKYENFLLQSFEQVDHDDDSLLGIEDLAELLSADMKRHAEFMVALTGHASPGTKLEWRQFLRHFQSRDAAEAAPREASESPEAPDVAKGPDAFFQHFAGTLLDRAVEQMSGP
eukprot:g15804.t1